MSSCPGTYTGRLRMPSSRVYSGSLAALTVPSLTKATPETEPVGVGEGLVGAPPHELTKSVDTRTTASKASLLATPLRMPCLQYSSTKIREP